MWIALAALLLSLTLAAQTAPAGTEEVRVSSRPYIPFHLRVESNLVQVNAVVRDRSGRAVPGLKRADFQLFEEGKPREIATFSVDVRPAPGGTAPALPLAAQGSAAPPAAPSPLRFVAMYFDDYGTAAGELAFTRNAAKHFVEDSLSPNDRVAVFTTSSGRITKDYSDDKKQLVEAIDKVQTHSRFSQSDTAACPRITPYDAYKITVLMDEIAIHSAQTEASVCGLGLPSAPPTPMRAGSVNRLSPQRSLVINQATQIWDQVRVNSQNTLAAISFALGELYRMPGPRTPGSRVLLLVSSGFLTGTLERERDLVIDQALRAGVVINSLDAKGLFAEPPGRPFGEDPGTTDTPGEVYVQETLNAIDRQEEPSSILANFSASTGGLYFRHNNAFSDGFRALGAVPETTYMLGFRPDESDLDGKYHKLKVRRASPGSSGVQARPGYFAAKPAEETGRAELDRQVTGSDVLKDLAAVVEAQAGVRTSNGMTPLRVKMHVDLKGVEFPQQAGRHMQKLTFVFALLDKDATIVAAREGVMDFALTEAKFGSLMDSGVNAVLTLEAPSGIYRLRTVAIEGLRSKMASLSYAIKLP
jgi:VWFA-related protein